MKSSRARSILKCQTPFLPWQNFLFGLLDLINTLATDTHSRRLCSENGARNKNLSKKKKKIHVTVSFMSSFIFCKIFHATL